MRLRILTSLALTGLVGIMAVHPAAAAARVSRSPIDRVLVVSLPGVGWRDLARQDLPNLRRLLDGAAVADLSTRAPNLRSDLAGNYATLSAGDKAVGASTIADASGIAPAGAAFAVDEQIGAVSAGAVFGRRTGRDAGAGLVVLGVEQIAVANAATPFHASVGALGDSLAAAGWTRAVIANGDGSEVGAVTGEPRRAAAVTLMGADGTVPAGELSPRLLAVHADAPFGVQLDLNAVEMAFAVAWIPRSVVMVEASDLVRAAEYRSVVGAAQAHGQRIAALHRSDEMVGRLLARVDLSRDAVVVVGTAPNPVDGRLAAVAVRAPGVPAGLLRSGTTQRTGFVQLMDVAPSVLDLVGVEVPSTMRGRPVSVGERSHDAGARVRFLIDADRAAQFRAEIQQPVASVFLAIMVVLLGAAGAAFARPRGPWPAIASWWGLITIAFLPAVYLARMFPLHTLGHGAFWIWISLASGALAALARLVGRRHVLDPVIVLLAVIVAVLGLDVISGSPLQFNGALGFSPEVAGRFIGFGNAGFAVFGAAALFLAGLVAVRFPHRGRILGVAVLGGAVVLDGAPIWGADVGGVLSLVPAYGLVVMRLLGWRVRLRAIALVTIGTVVALAGAIAVDMSRPPGSRTHLGRLIEQVQREGPTEFVDVVTRKLGLNLASWSSSPYRWLLPVVLVGFVGVRMLPNRFGLLAWRRIDPTGAMTIGFGVLVVFGYAMNDTGVLVPALMGAIALAILAWVGLEPLVAESAAAVPPGRGEYRRAPA